MWKEMANVFRWWMIPLALLIIALGLLLVVSMAPDDLLPHEYEVH